MAFRTFTALVDLGRMVRSRREPTVGRCVGWTSPMLFAAYHVEVSCYRLFFVAYHDKVEKPTMSRFGGS